ncbi:hypothetical protein NONI108955_24020 [Nocardia ninae]
MVEGDGFEVDADAAVDSGGGDAGAQEGGGVVGARGGGDDEAGDVAQGGDGVVVVEVAAETLLVGVAGDADHHRIVVAPMGKEGQGGGLAAQLVGGIVHVGQVLDLGDRHETGERGAQRGAENALLVEQGVEDASLAELLLQTLGHAVHAALKADVLAEDQHVRIAGEQACQCAVDRLPQR